MMKSHYKNLVFAGGGVLGIAYLGALQYLYDTGVFPHIKKIAGTSAGAITACMASFGLPFPELKKIADTLEYKKVPGKEIFSDPSGKEPPMLREFEALFGDYNCVYRLLTNYGWFSSAYLYHWLQDVIASQFDASLKKPPYTFADFKDPYAHNNKTPFLDLYVTGTNVSFRSSKIFSFETTPDMEVAEAVRISMSIPLFFESVTYPEEDMGNQIASVYCDGGIMWNYPITIFDNPRTNNSDLPSYYNQTLGIRFVNEMKYHKIDNLLSYIKNLYLSQMHVQQDMFKRNPEDIKRSVIIDTGDISFMDFDIVTGDETYEYLYRQGYEAAIKYFNYH